MKEGYEKNKYVYALVLTDISMPVMDGYELADEIRNFYRQNRIAQPMIVACTDQVEEKFI